MAIGVRISVCDGNGWHDFACRVSRETLDACYALPKEASRADFWRSATGYDIPNGHVLIWSAGS